MLRKKDFVTETNRREIENLLRSAGLYDHLTNKKHEFFNSEFDFYEEAILGLIATLHLRSRCLPHRCRLEEVGLLFSFGSSPTAFHSTGETCAETLANLLVENTIIDPVHLMPTDRGQLLLQRLTELLNLDRTIEKSDRRALGNVDKWQTSFGSMTKELVPQTTGAQMEAQYQKWQAEYNAWCIEKHANDEPLSMSHEQLAKIADRVDEMIEESTVVTRPSRSLAESIRQFYLGTQEGLFVGSNLVIFDQSRNVGNFDDAPMINQGNCVSDEEKFWFSMSYLKHKSEGEKPWPEARETVARLAPKFSQEEEVASLLNPSE